MSNTETTFTRYEVDLTMVGDPIPAGFDLATFCDRLDAHFPEIEFFPVANATNDDPSIVDDAEWCSVLDAYCDEIDPPAKNA